MIVLPIIGFAVTMAMMLLLTRCAPRWRLEDSPANDSLKSHTTVKPMIGGIAMWFSLALVGCAAYVWKASSEIIVLILISSLPLLLGLFDDLRWKNDPERYRPWEKFTAQILVSTISGILLWVVGAGNSLGVSVVVLVPAFSFVVFGGMNATNMQDGLDGVAGTVALISLLGFAFSLRWLGDDASMLLSFVLIGILVAFLLFNWPPAKAFMGDSGSHWVGFMLIVLAIRLANGLGSFWFLPLTCAFLGISVIDAGSAVARRALAGERLFLGDRNHLYDRLIRNGLGERATILIYSAAHLFIVAILIMIVFLVK